MYVAFLYVICIRLITFEEALFWFCAPQSALNSPNEPDAL